VTWVTRTRARRRRRFFPGRQGVSSLALEGPWGGAPRMRRETRVANIDVAAWLGDLGLAQYQEAFARNAVDAEVVFELTADDLKDLGVEAVGHRRRLLAAIAALRRDKIIPEEA